MPYIDKDFKPTVFEYTNVNDYNRLLVYYPRKGGRRVTDPFACDFTFSPIFPPSPTPTSTVTPTITPTASVTPTPSITPSVTVTPTPSPSIPSGYADATAYLAAVVSAGGTTDATIDAAVDTLFVDLKAAGVYSKLFAFYPAVGGTAASHAINANLSTSYDLTFAGGWTHDVSGMTSNGSNAYADTNVTPQDLGSAGTGLDNHHMSSSASANSVAGYEGAGPSPYMAQRMKSIQFLDAQSNTGTLSNYWTNVGWQCHNRVASNDFNGWAQADGGTLTELFTNSSNATSITSNTLYIGRINGTTFYSGNRYNFWTCGDGLTDTEVSDLNTAINTFNNSLSRRGY